MDKKGISSAFILTGAVVAIILILVLLVHLKSTLSSTKTSDSIMYEATVDNLAPATLQLLAAAQRSREQKDSKQTLKEVVAHAKARNELLAHLIQENPQEVVRVALPTHIREQLPLQAQEYIEKEVTLKGKLTIEHADDFEHRIAHYWPRLTDDQGNTYTLHFTDSIPLSLAQEYIEVKGIQLDEDIAVMFQPAAAQRVAFSPISDEGLVGYWKLDEGAGTTPQDSSGYNNHAYIFPQSFSTPQWSNIGISGKSLLFDGSDDYFIVQDRPLLNPTSALTISVFVRQEGSSLVGRGIIRKGQFISTSSWGVDLINGNRLQATIANGQVVAKTPAGSFLQGEAWHHVAFTFNGAAPTSTERFKIYIDGVQQTLEFNATVPASLMTGRDIFVGKSNWDSWKGNLEEIRMYNRTLTASEIFLLANEFNLTGRSLSSKHQRKLAVILFNAPGATLTATPAQVRQGVYDAGYTLAGFYDEATYGNINITGLLPSTVDIFGPYSNAGCPGNMAGVMTLDPLATADGARLDEYDHIAYYGVGGCAGGSGGLADIAGRRSIVSAVGIDPATGNISGRSLSFMAHELGHNFIMNHANILFCDSPSCGNQEYGDPYDVMGFVMNNPRQLNNFHREQIGAFTQQEMLTVGQDGNYTLVSTATPRNTGFKLIRIPTTYKVFNTGFAGGDPRAPVQGYYYLEYRRPTTNFDAFAPTDPVVNKVSIRFASDYEYTLQSHLFPSLFGEGDMYIDSMSNILIRVLDIDADNASIQVLFGSPPCVRNVPLLTLSPHTVYGSQGGQFAYDLSIINTDTQACDVSTYEITPQLPQGWSYTVSSHISLISGQQQGVPLTLIAPPNTEYDFYDFNINVSNLNLSTQSAAQASGTAVVQPLNVLLNPVRFSQYGAAPPNTTNYTQPSMFFVNITNASKVDTAYVILNNRNVTLSLNDDLFSVTLSTLAVGNYSYHFWANNTYGASNATPLKNYSITRATPLLDIIVPSPVSSTAPTTAAATGCPMNVVCTLYLDNVIVSNPSTTFLSVGVHNYTYVARSNQNYTSTSITKMITSNAYPTLTLQKIGIGQGNVTTIQTLPPPLGSTRTLWIRMDDYDEPNKKIIDISGTTNNATVRGMASQSQIGRFGKSFSFGRIGSQSNYLEIPHSQSLMPQREITLSTWVYPTNGNGGILFKGPLTNSYGAYSLSYASNYVFTLNGFSQVSSTTPVVYNTWTHIAATYDGTAQKIYINGVLEGTTPYTALINQDTNPFHIGIHYTPLAAFFGFIDEVQVFNRSLTANEVAIVYNDSLQGLNDIACGSQCSASYLQGTHTTLQAVPANPTTTFDGWSGACSGRGVCSVRMDAAKTVVANFTRPMFSSLLRGLVARYTFDGSFLDSSGNNNQATPLNGATRMLLNGNDEAAVFDGVNDYLRVPHSQSLALRDALTVSLWVKPDGGSNNGLIFKGPLTDSQGVYSITLGSRFAFRLNGESDVYSTTAPVYNTWTHIAATYDGTAQKIYINGVLEGTTSYNQPISANTDPLSMGTYYSPQYVVDGSINSVLLFNRSLTQSEVQQLYTDPSLISTSILHPADIDIDFRLTFLEFSNYNRAYKLQEPWQALPSPPTIAYYTRALSLFKRGETYTYNSSSSCPLCWVK